MTRRKATRAFRVVVGAKWRTMDKEAIAGAWSAFLAGLAEAKQISMRQLGAWQGE